jgi:hypothetical protein
MRMRNDARPIGHDESAVASHQAPVASHQAPASGDSRESVIHDRQSHIINRGADENARRDADVDAVMPTGDSSLRTNI